MKKHKLNILIPALVTTLFFTGCIKDEIVVTDPQKIGRAWDIAAPIANINVGVDDLLDMIDSTSYIYIDNQGLINLQIDTTFNVGYDKIIGLDTNQVTRHYYLNNKKKSAKAAFVFNDTIVLTSTRDQRLDSMLVSSCFLNTSVVFPNNINGTYKITFPDFTMPDGSPITIERPITTETRQLDISGAMFRMIMNINDFSSYRVVTTVNVDGNQQIPNNSKIELRIQMVNLNPSEIWGYFGSMDVFELSQDMNIEMFKTMNLVDVIQLKELVINLGITNYFDIPFNVTFDSMLFKNTTKNQQVPLSFLGNNTIDISAGKYNNGNVTPGSDSIVINSQNSNLVDAINLFPDYIYYEIGARINPDGVVKQNYLRNNGTDKIYFDLGIRVPMWFKTSNYNRTDTIGFNLAKMLPDSSMVNYVDNITLYFDFENALPFNVSVQAYFAKQNGTIVDSLFSCQTNSTDCYNGKKTLLTSGDATNPVKSKTDVVITGELAKKLVEQNVTQILVATQLSTGPIAAPDFVKLKQDNYIKIDFDVSMKSSANK